MINKQDFIDHLSDALPNNIADETSLSKGVLKALKTYTWKSGDFLTSTKNGGVIICVLDKFDSDDTFISSFSIRSLDGNYTVSRHECFYLDDFRKSTEEEYEIISKAITENGYRWLYGMILPRFGVGQYIVDESSNKVYIITEIVDNVYNCKDLDGNTGALLINDRERNLPLHAWTIDDAKEGQLLASKKDKVYVRFKEVNPDNSFYFVSLYDIDGYDNSVNDEPSDEWVSDAFVPATKGQIEEVFRIMELNGFTYVDLSKFNGSTTMTPEYLISLVKDKYPDYNTKQILKLFNEAINKLLTDEQS